MPTSVKSPSRRVLRAALVTLLAISFLGLIAPFINARIFAGRIQQQLEISLGRKIDFDKVHFTLFSGPGFSLENVTIHEDPRYGLEPFASVTSLRVRLRIDKLLFGHLRFSTLRLVEPSLNLVKRSDGTWNVVELVERLSAPRRLPLNLFPAIEISNGRLNFKFGTRKTVLYIADSDLSIYPERSGKLFVQFSGSPARTDRAGNGFGHLRGSANWYVNPPDARADQLEADVILDPSNLSELTTLFEGHDAGVHGTVSSRVHIQGPATALRISGELRLADVHRWDLLPSSGEQWRIRYQGNIDLLAHRFDLETLPLGANETTPVALQLLARNFLVTPEWSVSATLNKAPVKNLLPLARRLGFILPDGLTLSGMLDGAIKYSNREGVSGNVAIANVTATLPNVAPVRVALAQATISGDCIHLDPTTIETAAGGALQAGGDYYLSTRRAVAYLNASDFSVSALKSTVAPWFTLPAALEVLNQGMLTGKLVFTNTGIGSSSSSGQFQFAESTLNASGVAAPLKDSQGHVTFDTSNLEVTDFSATLGEQAIYGSYRYDALAKRPERVRLDLPSADFAQIEAALAPTLEAQGLLARLRVTRRPIPPWLAARNLEGDVTIGRFSVNQTDLGPVSSHFVWEGTMLQFTSLRLNLPEGLIRARGMANLASYSPRYRFTANVSAFPWKGGLLSAAGQFETAGTGADSLRNLHAAGTFSGEGISFSPDDVFNKISGTFDFSFAGDWPNLHLTDIQASQNEDAWSGEAQSQSDGKLVLDLEHEGRQRRVISTLLPESPAIRSALPTRGRPR